MGEFNRVLAIETSCDDTSVAVVERNGFVRSVLSASQLKVHKPFGGIVPEEAGRDHTRKLLLLIDQLLSETKLDWKDIDGIGVTSQPGLLVALMVGVVTAKSLSLATNLPFIGVDHLEGHLNAGFLKDDNFSPPKDFQYPYIGLNVSGGHTALFLVEGIGQYKVLGSTFDDAAGEAFDKFAKMVGLGYPGGVLVDKSAQKGYPNKFNFPRALMKKESLDFSFSGLKSAAQRELAKMSSKEIEDNLSDLCASFQEAVTDTLIEKLDRALKKYPVQNALITGGVSANSRLREKGQELSSRLNKLVAVPPIRYCTDNAAMIGYVAIERLNRGERSNHRLSPLPTTGLIVGV